VRGSHALAQEGRAAAGDRGSVGCFLASVNRLVIMGAQQSSRVSQDLELCTSFFAGSVYPNDLASLQSAYGRGADQKRLADLPMDVLRHILSLLEPQDSFALRRVLRIRPSPPRTQAEATFWRTVHFPTAFLTLDSRDVPPLPPVRKVLRFTAPSEWCCDRVQVLSLLPTGLVGMEEVWPKAKWKRTQCFTVYQQGDWVALLAHNGCFLSADRSGTVTATRRRVERDERWKLFTAADMGEPTRPGPRVVQTYHCHHTDADHAGFLQRDVFGYVTANGTAAGNRQLWDIECEFIAPAVFKQPLYRCPCWCGSSRILPCDPCMWREKSANLEPGHRRRLRCA